MPRITLLRVRSPIDCIDEAMGTVDDSAHIDI